MAATLTLWNKHMRKFLANPMEMFGLAIQPILWVMLYGVGMKSMMGPAMPGIGDQYVSFMVPGIVALSALGGAVGGGSVWLTERLRGIVKEYLVAPIPRMSILMGNALSTMTKSLFQAVLILIVGLLMGAKLSANPLGWLGGLLLVAGYGLGFSGVALATASSTDNPGAYHSMIMLLNLPLLFLSNALYPLDSLPTWMRIGALINPTSWVIDGVRQTMLKDGAAMAGGEVLPLWLCFVIVAAFAALGMRMAYTAFKASLK
ncbi:MAG: ABC transporter permease [Chloroflexi bacterium]|nr:ABC transporter permease [Chloroflexota bacterium]